MLHFASAGAHSKGVLYCRTCHTNVKVTEVLKRPIFNSYQWGNNLSTQKIAVRLCERVFLATEMPYWLDIGGGMGFGDELVSAMQEGVKGCKVAMLCFFGREETRVKMSLLLISFHAGKKHASKCDYICEHVLIECTD